MAGRAIVLLAASLVGGCGIWPTVPTTETEPPASPSVWLTQLPEAPDAPENWVEQFQSDRLLQWIKEAEVGNLDLAGAWARYDAARQTARSRNGARLPPVELQTFLTSVRVLERSDPPPVQPPPGSNTGSPIWGLVSNWEVDLWGRVAALAKAARANYVASAADLAGVNLSVTAGIVSSWAQLGGAVERTRLAERELRVRTQALRSTESSFEAGLVTSLDIRLARSAEASARAGIAATRREVAQLTRELEVLLGRYPAGRLRGEPLPDTLSMMADLSSPIEILTRRPDVLAAEARLEAAGFEAKAARAAMWPVLNLQINLQSATDLALAFNTASLASDLILTLIAPLFRGGSLFFASKAAVAQAEAAAASYAQTVLQAWREVENARHAEILLAEEEVVRAAALEESLFAEELANRQYGQGLISIFNLIDAQTRSIASSNALIRARTERILNRINYHRALGGSYGLGPAPGEQDEDMPDENTSGAQEQRNKT